MSSARVQPLGLAKHRTHFPLKLDLLLLVLRPKVLGVD